MLRLSTPLRAAGHALCVLLFLAGALPTAGLLAAPPACAQSRSERSATQERLDAVRQQIASSERRLSEAAKAERASEEKLKALSRRIAESSELVRLYEARLGEIRHTQGALEDSVAATQQRMEKLKEEYRRRATHAYKHGRLHDLALILSARSVNEMLTRVRYLRRFTQQRKGRLAEMEEATAQIQAQQQRLQQKRDSTTALLQEASSEEQTLATLRQDRRGVVSELRAQQASLEEDLSAQQAQAQQLQARLEQMASREAARSQRRTATASPERRAAFARLTGSFEDNKGGLPWPAEGVVSESFGTHVDPVHGTKRKSPGIVIATEPQRQVQAVFEGEVTRVDQMPGLGTLVFVRHGEYLSVYGNLSRIYVGQGQPIGAGDAVGLAGTDSAPRGAGVFFALFRKGTAANPEAWLTSR